MSSSLAKELSVLPKRKIGDRDVFCVGYGCMGLSAFYGKPMDDEDRLKVCVRHSIMPEVALTGHYTRC